MVTKVFVPVLVALISGLPESALLLLLIVLLIEVVSLLFIVALSPAAADRVVRIVEALPCSSYCIRSHSRRCRRSH
jgi:hypothetical protein